MDNPLEDGEISDDSDCYVPLKRPSNYSAFSSAAVKPEAPDDDSDSPETLSSSSDSDGAARRKRPKLKPRPAPFRAGSVNRKYDVWSARIREDVLADTLNTCDVTKRDRSRAVETYDYPVRDDFDEEATGRDLRSGRDDRKSNGHAERRKRGKGAPGGDRANNKRTRDDRRNKDLRSVGRKHEEDEGRAAPRHLVDLSVTAESTEGDIAKDLANKLLETKEDLLVKIVTVIGKERSIKIFNDVKRIEEEGGMLIMNQSRRRTPGGVYLFLVKHDNLTQEQMTGIFEEDKQKSKQEMRVTKRKKFSKIKLENAFGKNVPGLLTADELCIEKINEKRRADKAGGMEHEEVENPPPTPETDCPDAVEEDKGLLADALSGRRRQDYDEDFLDLGAANDMDLF